MRQGSLLGAVLVFCSVVLATAVGTPVPALAQGAAEDCLAPPPKNQDLTLVDAYAASPPAVDEVAFTMENENLMALTYGGDLVQYNSLCDTDHKAPGAGVNCAGVRAVAVSSGLS